MAPDIYVWRALGVSSRTLDRHRAAGRPPDADVGDGVARTERVLALAVEVAGSRDEAERWLVEPAMGLEQRRQVALLQSSIGAQAVETLLHRIDRGGPRVTQTPALRDGVLRYWRLERSPYAATWQAAEGAYRYGGRWSSVGRRVLHASCDPSTAILEVALLEAALLEVALHEGFQGPNAVPHDWRCPELVTDALRVVEPGEVPGPRWLAPTAASVAQQQFGDHLLAFRPGDGERHRAPRRPPAKVPRGPATVDPGTFADIVGFVRTCICRRHPASVACRRGFRHGTTP